MLIRLLTGNDLIGCGKDLQPRNCRIAAVCIGVCRGVHRAVHRGTCRGVHRDAHRDACVVQG